MMRTIVTAGLALVMLGGLSSCEEDCEAETYCVRGTTGQTECQVVEVCDVCLYDEDCCDGLESVDCALEPYPY